MTTRSPLKPAKDEIKAAMSQLARATAPMNRGDTLAFTVIEAAFGIERYTGSWTYLLKKFRHQLLNDRGIVLKPIIGVGYELCTERDQVQWVAKNRQSRARRQVGRAIKEIAAGSVETLSPRERQHRSLAIDSLKHERRVMSRCMREQDAVMKPTPTNPLQPKPGQG